ncbi:GntR family transcriptional regulator [bacterium]|nr:MAG: GntR family transcriptional regulator [bacterium]
MDAFQRRTPHYLRIYRDLKDRIGASALAPGERLSTQRELAQEYGVTVMTVRQALQLLEQEELVVMRHGLGTFVAPRRIRYAMGNLRSLAQEVADQGLELKTRVLRRELVAPHPHVAELLQIEAGELVYAIERLRFVGAQPIVYQHSQLQAWLGETLDDVDLNDLSLYDYLQGELKIEVAHAHERIQAITLAPHEATLLEEEPGAAALLSERLTFAAGGEPIIFDRAFMPADRVSVATERFVSDVTVDYELRLGEEGE